MPTDNNVTDTTRFSGQLVKPPWFYRQWMLVGNPAYFFDHLTKEFGDFIHYRGLFNFFLINHPALVKQVLQETHHSFDKRSVIYDRFRNAFGEGLVVSEGQRWRRQRKLMQPFFGPGAVERYFDLMVDSAQHMIRRWQRRCDTNEVFNVADEMHRITLEIVGRALFRDDFDDAHDDISRWTKAINHYSAKPPIPLIRSFWFPSSINRNLKKTLQEFHTFLQQMIDERRQAGKQRDLLSMLLHAKTAESADSMSDAEMRDEALGMIIGGHETTASALTWAWYELSRHPQIRSQLHRELDSVVGDGPLTVDHIPQLRYVKMIVDETLRLHPPFWFENRNVARDVSLGGTTVPKGSIVAFSRYSLHRHATYWKHADQFLPERFAPGNEENKRSTHAHVPFGGGPRICIGIHFAMMELIIILTTVAQHYDVIVDATDRHKMAAHLTMTPKYGVRVRLKTRS